MATLRRITDAVDDVLAEVRPMPAEPVPLVAALGRVSAGRLVARDDVPGFTNSAMDGFAYRAADGGIAVADGLRVTADIPAGTAPTVAIGRGEAARIMTGAPLPQGADTVVPVEQTSVVGETVLLTTALPEGANVRASGEDVRAGSVVVQAGRVLRPADLGLLAATGIAAVPVARRPRVAIIATGSELVAPEEPVGPGLIRNSNSFTACGQALEAGAEPVMLGVARDERDVTRRLLEQALSEDIVITSGGVSVGDYDFVKDVQDELGVERRFWGVRVKPGKPLAFGVREGTLVFGVPGNPVAAMTSFELFVRPAILSMLGRRDIWRPMLSAEAEEPVRPTKERAELRRCRVTLDGRPRFSLTGAQGSGVLSSMTLADALLMLPTGFPGAPAGERFTVMLLEGSSTERPTLPD
jgi:molybdopterin molybdotransferase